MNFVQAIFTSADVVQVNTPSATGDMGILANHVPTVEPLRPGVVEVIEATGGPSKKWFGMWSVFVIELLRFMLFQCLADSRPFILAVSSPSM